MTTQVSETIIDQILAEASAAGRLEAMARADRMEDVVAPCRYFECPELAYDMIRSNATVAEARDQLRSRQAADRPAPTLQCSMDEALEAAAAARFGR